MSSKAISLQTRALVEFIDITGEAEKFVREVDVAEGILHIYAMHTTAAIIINEGERGLIEDFRGLFDSLVPKGAGYAHDRIDDNAHAHLRAVLCGGAKTVPIVDGKLQLGTWQRIFLAEFDGPRKRDVWLQASKLSQRVEKGGR